MLVLSRKHGESVCIGPNITVTVLSVDGSRVKIGVTAPSEIFILRGELRELVDPSSGLGLAAVGRTAVKPAAP
jgi:carbon storage regulator